MDRLPKALRGLKQTTITFAYLYPFLNQQEQVHLVTSHLASRCTVVVAVGECNLIVPHFEEEEEGLS